jgi:hypothetical protein
MRVERAKVLQSSAGGTERLKYSDRSCFRLWGILFLTAAPSALSRLFIDSKQESPWQQEHSDARSLQSNIVQVVVVKESINVIEQLLFCEASRRVLDAKVCMSTSITVCWSA